MIGKEMNNKEIPCKDCLILGLCKGRMKVYYQEEIEYQKENCSEDDEDPYPFYEFGKSVEDKRQSICVENLTYDCVLMLEYIYSVKTESEEYGDNYYTEDKDKTIEVMRLFFGAKK